MRLLRLEIENFGKLSRYALDMQDGLNVVCKDRKSTRLNSSHYDPSRMPSSA